MNNKVTHYAKYFKRKCILAYKRLIEYRANFLAALLSQTSYTAIVLIFGWILVGNFGEYLNWGFAQYLIFYALQDIISTSRGAIISAVDFSQMLKTGEFNQILTRPGNPLLNLHLNVDEISLVFLGFTIFILLPVGLYLYPPTLLGATYAFFCCFLVMFLDIMVHIFANSFNFHAKDASNILSKPVKETSYIFRSYPGSIAGDVQKKIFLAIIPIYFVGTLIMPLYQGAPVQKLGLQLAVITSLLFIFISGTIVNWKIGLKKYEGYG